MGWQNAFPIGFAHSREAEQNLFGAIEFLTECRDKNELGSAERMLGAAPSRPAMETFGVLRPGRNCATRQILEKFIKLGGPIHMDKNRSLG